VNFGVGANEESGVGGRGFGLAVATNVRRHGEGTASRASARTARDDREADEVGMKSLGTCPLAIVSSRWKG
jgi:hypothetical protein